MIELNLTGWMSNRGRQIVASFLTKDLGCDWRFGAEYFESKLIDHSVESNWGNWTYSAGVGVDPRENRYFNLAKQAKNYDKDGTFQKLWLSSRKEDVFHKIPYKLGKYAPAWQPNKYKKKEEVVIENNNVEINSAINK